jgi:hypothetical protein
MSTFSCKERNLRRQTNMAPSSVVKMYLSRDMYVRQGWNHSCVIIGSHGTQRLASWQKPAKYEAILKLVERSNMENIPNENTRLRKNDKHPHNILAHKFKQLKLLLTTVTYRYKSFRNPSLHKTKIISQCSHRFFRLPDSTPTGQSIGRNIRHLKS